ncbi:MAG: FtsW/RodA/SpoVE family cell cycle protein [Hymenobacter sp.]
MVLIGVLLVVDYKACDAPAYALYGGMILLLVVTIFVARPIAGSRSWLELGPVRLQPAEFAKFTTALAAWRFMAGINLRQLNWRDQAAGRPHAAARRPHFASNETGQALVFAALLLAFFPRRHVAADSAAAGGGGIILLLALLVPKAWLVGGFTVDWHRLRAQCQAVAAPPALSLSVGGGHRHGIRGRFLFQ